MKIGVMQPYFFPYLGYWQLINAVDKYVIYDDVNYIKNGWINRNNILLNQQKHLITIPLNKASPFLLINKIKTTPVQKEKEKRLKTIEMVYKKAPYFNSVFPMIRTIIMMENSDLIINNLVLQFKTICKYLDIQTELILSSSLDKDNSLKAQNKVIHICKLLGGTQYINAIGGQKLYDFDDFKKNGLELSFLKTEFTPYKQFNNDFISGLSMIDILMFNDVGTIKQMLDNYELIKGKI